MQNKIMAAALLLSVSALAAGTLEPLNIKPGLWRVTMTSKISTLPRPNTHSYNSCVKKADLQDYPFTDPDAKCNWTVVSSTGSKMEANGTCMPEGMGKVDFKISLEAANSESVTGTGHLSFDGPSGSMNGIYEGSAKWIGASCPAASK